jgi:hypothetical protein
MPVLLSTKPRRRFSLRCRLFRRHAPATFGLRATGESWRTEITYCARCATVIDLHAERQ